MWSHPPGEPGSRLTQPACLLHSDVSCSLQATNQQDEVAWDGSRSPGPSSLHSQQLYSLRLCPHVIFHTPALAQAVPSANEALPGAFTECQQDGWGGWGLVDRRSCPFTTRSLLGQFADESGRCCWCLLSPRRAQLRLPGTSVRRPCNCPKDKVSGAQTFTRSHPVLISLSNK